MIRSAVEKLASDSLYSDRAFSPYVAQCAQISLSRTFCFLEEVEPPSSIKDRLVTRGHGELVDYHDQYDAIGRFEIRRDVDSMDITFAEFQGLCPSADPEKPDFVTYTRFRFPGSPPLDHTPLALLDTWSVPSDVYDSLKREEGTGVHVGAVAVNRFIYGRNTYLEGMTPFVMYSALSKLEDGAKYYAEKIKRAEVEDEARLSRQKAAI